MFFFYFQSLSEMLRSLSYSLFVLVLLNCISAPSVSSNVIRTQKQAIDETHKKNLVLLQALSSKGKIDVNNMDKSLSKVSVSDALKLRDQ